MLELQGRIQTKINALRQTQAVAKQYLISYSEAKSYASQLLERERQEGVYQKSQSARAKAISDIKKLQKIQAPPSDVTKYQQAGYSQAESQALAQWSSEHQQSPTPQMVQKIIRGEVTTSTIVSYDWMGKPQYVSVAPGALTPYQRSMQKLGMQITPPSPKIKEYERRPSIWETRGTYLPREEFVEVKGEPMGLGTFTRKVIQAPADLITGLPTREREYREEELWMPTPVTEGVPRRETMIYEPPKLPTSQEIKKERILTEAIEQTIMGIQVQEKINEVYNNYSIRLQKSIDSGISKEDLKKEINNYQKSAEKEVKDYVNKLDKQYETELEKRERDRVIKFVTLEMSTKFWRNRISNLLRVGMYTIPFYGKALLVSDIFGAPKELKETYKFAREYPETIPALGIEAGATLLTFGLGGYGLAKVKGIRTGAKIREAIKTGEVKVKTMGGLTESKITALKIPTEGKLQMKTIVKQGGSIRKYDTVIKYPKKTKYTPDIKTTYYEFMDAKGNLIRRISFGEMKATLRGKKVNRIAFAEAMEKLSEKTGKVEGLAEVVITKEPVIGYDLITRKMKVKYPKAKKYRTYYDIETLGQIKRGKARIIKVKSTSELLGTTKYKGEPLLKGYGVTKEGILLYPEYKYFKGKGKPFTEGTFIEYGRLKRIKVDLREVGRADYFMKVDKRFDTFGTGVVKFIKEKPPKKTILRGWIDEPLPDVVTKVKPPKPFKEPLAPSIPFQRVSQWYGKRILVPETFTPSVITTSFASELPIAFTKGGIWTGTVRGIGLGFVDITKPKIEVDTRMKITEKFIEPTKLKIKTKELLFQKPKLAEEQITGLIPRQEFLMKESTLLQQNLLIGQTQIQKQELKQVQKQIQIQKLVSPPTPVTKPITTPGFGFGAFFFPGEKPKYVKKKPYNAYAYIEAKGIKPHWEKIDNRPLTYKSAMSVASEYVDENISARGKAIPIKPKIIKGKKVKPKKQAIDLGTDYFGVHRKKFRTFKSRKGVRTKLPKGNFIELQKHRLDKPMETRGIIRGWGKRRTPFGF